MKIELQEWQTRYILEALGQLEKQWGDTDAACNDEDLAADIGNDMTRLTAAHDYLERVAVEAFGPGVKELSREPIFPTTLLTTDLSHPR